MRNNDVDYFRLREIPNLSEGETVGLERGSLFRGKGYISPGADNAAVKAYGEGSLPEIDCSVIADSDAWRSVSGRANTYRQEVDPPDYVGVADEAYPQAFENDREIPHQDTVADVERTPGSFHLDTSYDPWGLYYHPSGSTNPKSDGKRFEYAYTPIGVNLAGAGIHNKSGVVEGIKIRRPLGGRGCVGPGVGGAIKKCLLYQGGKHHTIHPGGLIEDTVFARSTINRNVLFSSAIAWFQGKHITETYNAEVRRTVFRSMQASPSLTHDSNFAETIIEGGVFYDVPRAGGWPGDQLTMNGGYLYNAGTVPAIDGGTGHTYVALMIDGLTREGAGGGVMRRGFTMRHSVVVDQVVGQKFDADVSIAFENCVLIDSLIGAGDHTPTLRLKNCIVAPLHDRLTGGTFSIDPASDHCLFVTNSDATETFINGDSRSLQQLQNDTGAFANSAFLTVEQWRNLLQGWRRGDVRLQSEARVTHADGTVSETLPDGTPLSAVGPQKYWDGKTNQLKDGRPTQWPTPPLTEEEDEAFVAGEWDWFQTPRNHERTVPLGDRLAAYWAMDMHPGSHEWDLVGSSDLMTVGGRPGTGGNENFGYRRFDGLDDYLQGDPTSALQDPVRFWLAFPVRPQSLDQEGARILAGIPPSGYSIGVGQSNRIRFRLRSRAFSAKTTASVLADATRFQVVQMWSDPERARIGFRIGQNEVVRDGAYGTSIRTGYRPFTVCARPNGGFNFAGDIGPLMIASAVPRKTDREWLDNEGRFRTLTEIRNREVTMLEI